MTIVDIAKESGYSVTTVSRVLNNRQDVSPAAKETIMKIVEAHNLCQIPMQRGSSRQFPEIFICW